ncbi:MAG TPA: DUF4062 domain-containing protein [Steroidobacteraceae bacterium]|jgi:hypothetical protein|nr:DUF4062 domain-containing protein [Steroidobacteraceae bacterium]
MTTDLRIAQLQARNPDALRLAQLSGFAVRLEPLLLRTLRQKFIPSSDPSAEIDLWNSRLMQSRSATAAVFNVFVLGRLRESLTQDGRRKEILEVTQQCFREHPPLHRFEIELNSLPIVDPNVKDADIEKSFEPLIAQLRLGGDAAQRIARWLLQAAPRWHERVRGTGAAWASLISASAVLNGRRIVEGAPPVEMSGERLAQAMPTTISGTKKLGLVRTEKYLRFTAADVPEVAVIDVPAYSPLLLLLESSGEAPRVIDVNLDVEFPVPGSGPITLRSLLGDAWRIEYVPSPDAVHAENAPEQPQADDDVVTGDPETPPEIHGDTRRVIIIMGSRRRDAFEALSDSLRREKYQPVLPDHFMGDPKASPAIHKLLRTARFVVIDAGLPQRWLKTWFEAFHEHPRLPVLQVLNELDKFTLAHAAAYSLDRAMPDRIMYGDARQLAQVAFARIIEPAEKLRLELQTRPETARERLRVFVSSTVSDLSSYRQAVRDALTPVYAVITLDEMDASGIPLFETVFEEIDHCDIFICLVGQNYGYIPPEEASRAEPRSMIELQYMRARERGKPIVAFRIQEPGFTGALLVDVTSNLGRFRERLKNEVAAYVVQSPAQMVPSLLSKIGAIGQISGNGASRRPAAPSDGSVSDKPNVESMSLPDPPNLTVPAKSMVSDFSRGANYSDQRQVVAVGGLLLEFNEAVPKNLREPIANAMLLAQLATNKNMEPARNVSDWQKRFFEILGEIGWRVGEAVENVLSSSGRNRNLYESMIPMLTTLLGPSEAGASKMIEVLRGLGSTQDNSPWITMFNQSTRRHSGNTMEFCHVTTDSKGNISAKMLSCAIQTAEAFTQVLFIKTSRLKAEIRVSNTEISTTREALESTRNAIEKRVRPFVPDMVKSVEEGTGKGQTLA